ncbi:MAG: Strongly-conserved Zn-finger binding protein (TFIIIA) [Thelocarpon impressellum]|nr:MAG: Strongly-conserved Zn-finger binding protein (TFIIIA) [Thelocarpon impressellum]
MAVIPPTAPLSRSSGKRKRDDDHTDPGPQTSDYTSLPASDGWADGGDDESTSGSGDDGPALSPATPLTPLSPRRKFPSEEKIHHCPHEACGKSFNRPARLAEHLRSHTNDRPFGCRHDGCEKRFLRESHLSHHVKSAHTSVREHVCGSPGCTKRFLTATRLRRHQAVHEGQEKFRCSGHAPCNETFRKHATLQRHITSAHLNKKPFPCAQVDPVTGARCTQAYDTAGRLKTHEGRVHGGLRFWCSECPSSSIAASSATGASTPMSAHENLGLGFSTYALLQSHLRSAHPPTCELCAQPCSSQRELRQHLEIHHLPDADPGLLGRRTYTCEEPTCRRTFTKKYNLTIHTRTVHGGEKRFACTQVQDEASCGRAFKTKASLESHVRSQHLARDVEAQRQKTKWRQRRKKTPPPTATALTGASEHLSSVVNAGDDDALHEHAFDAFLDQEEEMERRAVSGGEFWVGGGEDMEVVDPILRYLRG